MDKKKRVAVVGAGTAGLTACKHLLKRGFDPIVFEADKGIGGVWARTLESTRLQSSAAAYRFSDFPWPEDMTDVYPKNEQVMEYLTSYAKHFGLLRCIKFGHRVVAMEFVGVEEAEMWSWEMWSENGEAFGTHRGEWHLTVQKSEVEQTEIYHVDFVILCLGRFSGVPNIPEYPINQGPEQFHGKALHSMDLCNMQNADADDLIRGKLVTVVGSGKSAYDILAECASKNGVECPCTMIYRTNRWLLHNTSVWGISIGYLYANRFSELLIHKPGDSLLQRIFATFLLPLRWLISRATETYYKRNIPLSKHGMVPNWGFFRSMYSCIVGMLPEKFYERVEEGSIIVKKANSFAFCKEGLVLEGGDERVKADVVVLATGFKGDQKLKEVFTSPSFQQIVTGSPAAKIPLYRECIHPRIPQMAVIGYAESLSNIHAIEMMAKWVAHFLDGAFRLPNIKYMEQDIIMYDKYMKRVSHEHFRRSCLGPVNIWYNDLLCRDMGYNPRRKKGLFAEWFQPYGSVDYANIQ